MKSITNLFKLFLIFLLMNSSAVKAQQWNFYKDPIYKIDPMNIDSRPGDEIFLQVNGKMYMKTSGSQSWSLMGNGVTSSSEFLEVNQTVDILYAPGYSGSSHFLIANINSPVSYAYQYSNMYSSGPNGMNSPTYSVISDGVNVVSFNYGGDNTVVARSTNYGVWNSWSAPTVLQNMIIHTSDKISTGVYIAGCLTSGKVIVSNDSGSTWNVVSTNPFVFLDIKKANANSIYAITNSSWDGNNFSIKKSIDNGVTWADANTGLTPQGFNHLYYHADSNKLYLSGTLGVYSMNTTTGSWENESFQLNNQPVYSITRSDNDLYCTVKAGANNSAGIFKRNINSTTWTRFEDGLSKTVGESKVHYLAKGVLFDSNNKMLRDIPSFNKIIRETATYWEEVSVPGTYSDKEIVKIVGDNNGTMYLTSRIDSSMPCIIKKSNNSFNTVTEYTTSLMGEVKIMSVSDNGKILLKKNQTYYVFDTITNTLIQVYQEQLGDYITNFFVLNSGLLILEQTPSFVSYSTDNGLNFTYFTNVMNIKDIRGNIVIANGNGYDFTIFNGSSLQSTDIPFNSSIDTSTVNGFSYELKDNNTLFLWTTYNNNSVIANVYKSTDMGVTWDAPIATLPTAKNIYIDNNNKIYLENFTYNNPALLSNNYSTNGFYYWGNALGTNDFDNQNLFSIYPNPTKDVININSESAIKNITIFNMLGQKVFSENVNSVTGYQTNISGLQQGTYLVKVVGEKGSQTLKIIKE